MVRVRVGCLPGQWQDLGPGSAITVHHRASADTTRHDSKVTPRPTVLEGDLSTATDRQLEALDIIISCNSQVEAAAKMGMHARHLRRLLGPLRDATGLTTMQLALLRDRQRRAA